MQHYDANIVVRRRNRRDYGGLVRRKARVNCNFEL